MTWELFRSIYPLVSSRGPGRQEAAPARVEAASSQVGEICFAGNIVMKGYLKDPAATAEAFRHGSFATGDLAVKDPVKIKEVLWGGYLHDPSDQFIHLVDGGQFTNHSDSPNCGGDWAADPKDEVSVAIRDIEEGEEITDDYGLTAEQVYARARRRTSRRALPRRAPRGAVAGAGPSSAGV